MAAFFLCGPSQNVIARSELPQAVNDEAISPLVCHADPALAGEASLAVFIGLPV